MPNPPRPGDPAPPIDLRTIQGERFQLADREGRAVVVTFLRHAG
jgi:peroxiredoxin